MNPHIDYLKYVIRHKWFVFQETLKLKDIRLIWRGLVHDMSKFGPREFWAYSKYFYGRNKGVDRYSFDVSWNYHQKLNDHHWQFWVLINDSGEIVPLSMPVICIQEMICDWKGAGRALGMPNTKEWYIKNYSKIMLHVDTRKIVNDILGVI